MKNNEERKAPMNEEKEQEIRSPYQAPDDVTGDQILAGVRSLCGVDELAALCEEIHGMAPLLKAKQLECLITEKAYLFSIEPGGGCTTAVWSLANLLNADHLVEKPISVIEVGDISGDLTESLINMNIFSLLVRVTDKMVVMDISNIMEEIYSFDFTEFLLQVQQLTITNRLIPVFVIPFVEADMLIRVQNVIMDVMNLETVAFVPQSFEGYTDTAVLMLEDEGFTVDASCRAYIQRRLTEEISDGRYYGYKTVRKLADEMIYGKLRGIVYGYDPLDNRITPDSLAAMPDLSVKKTPQEALDALIGREETVKQLKEIAAEIAANKKAGIRKPIHMQFAGSPGTGKSEAARAFARLLVEEGVLEKDLFIEREGDALIGYFAGSTGPLVARICSDAYGAVLYIASAGNLMGEDVDYSEYAKEARKTLAAFMEAHPDDMLVILADTCQELDRLYAEEPALAESVTYKIEFSDYTSEELAVLYLDMLKQSGLEADDGFKAAVKEYFAGMQEEISSDAAFSNARYVRNFFERTCSKFQTRLQIEGSETGNLTLQDFREASALVEGYNTKERRRQTIGFRMPVEGNS